MKRPGLILCAGSLIALGAVGSVVVASGPQNAPAQDARPADPIGDLLRKSEAPPKAAPAATQPVAPPQEVAPTNTPAPRSPVPITPPLSPSVTLLPVPEETTEVEVAEKAAETPAVMAPVEKVEEPEEPVRRQRRQIAIVEAIDKTTAERMRFEVAVGGRPVRFANALIFNARACEVTAPSETVRDAIAYLDISVQSRGSTETRTVYKGWMFASSPGISGLQHPNYDAWVVGCKA